MTENRHHLIQSQELRQEQVLSPQQIQSLDILLAPLLELQAKISHELTENPLLEQESAPGEELVGDPVQSGDGDGDDTAEDKKDDDQKLDELLKLSDSWHDSLPLRSPRNPDMEEKRRHFLDSLTKEQSLQENLLEQLSLAGSASEKIRALAELVIGSIDDQGFMRSHLADLAMAGQATMPEMEAALALVQSFDPPGIAARDVKESLMIQVERKGLGGSELGELVEKHLDGVAKNRLPQVAKAMNISMEKLYGLIERLKGLAPYPGSAIAPAATIYITPEVQVETTPDGDFSIVGNKNDMPRLRISRLYLRLLDDPDTPEETKAYIKEKLKGGEALIKSIEQRRKTIVRIAEVIIDAQHDFFERGVEHLHPLTMQQVADKLGIHETTVSRAIANKYIETPRGIFDFRFFFSFGYHAADGEEVSSRGVKSKLREIIAAEDKKKPLSDLKLVRLLEEQGLSVARRTVAKYREEMDIPPSNLRKTF